MKIFPLYLKTYSPSCHTNCRACRVSTPSKIQPIHTAHLSSFLPSMVISSFRHRHSQLSYSIIGAFLSLYDIRIVAPHFVSCIWFNRTFRLSQLWLPELGSYPTWAPNENHTHIHIHTYEYIYPYLTDERLWLSFKFSQFPERCCTLFFLPI